MHDLTTTEATRLTNEAEDKVPTYCIAGDGNRSAIFDEIAEKFGVEDPSDGVVTIRSATAVGRPLGTWPTDHAGLVGWNLNLPTAVVFEVPGVSNLLHPHLERYGKLVDFLREQKHA